MCAALYREYHVVPSETNKRELPAAIDVGAPVIAPAADVWKVAVVMPPSDDTLIVWPEVPETGGNKMVWVEIAPVFPRYMPSVCAAIVCVAPLVTLHDATKTRPPSCSAPEVTIAPPVKVSALLSNA